MPYRRLFTRADKQVVLACFKQNLSIALIGKKLQIPIPVLYKWHKLFLSGHTEWAKSDDKNLVLRLEAIKLFDEGCGYKKAAKLLNLPSSRTKYWLQLYYSGNREFFSQSRSYKRVYSAAEKFEILENFRKTKLSKKQFCLKSGFSISTLNRWLKEAEI